MFMGFLPGDGMMNIFPYEPKRTVAVVSVSTANKLEDDAKTSLKDIFCEKVASKLELSVTDLVCRIDESVVSLRRLLETYSYQLSARVIDTVPISDVPDETTLEKELEDLP